MGYLRPWLLISTAAMIGLTACSDSTDFSGSAPKIKVPDQKKIVGVLEKKIESYLQSIASCDLEAVRGSPDSTICNVSISGSSGLELLQPQLSPTSNLDPWVVTDGVLLSRVNCAASGSSIEAVFKDEVKYSNDAKDTNDSKDSKLITLASCGTEVDPIEKPSCSLVLEQQTINLGQEVGVTLKSTGGPISSANINGARTVVEQIQKFRPSAAGSFVLKGSVINPASTENCSATVIVNQSSSPIQVIAPSCSLTVSRENPLSVRCDISVSSTGGPISGNPVVSGAPSLTKKDSSWEGKVDCAALGNTFVATVSNVGGTSATCEGKVDAMAEATCSITAIRETPAATRCSLSVSTTGVAAAVAPTVSGVAKFTQKATSWESSIDCPAKEQTVSASVSNPRGSSICESKVPAIDKPACSISVGSEAITLGQSVSAILKSTGGPIVLAKINNASASLDEAVTFTPLVAGNYAVVGSVQNPGSTETCTTIVKVAAVPTPPIIPPSCSMTATRDNASPTQCKLVVSSTGGPMVGEPVVDGAAVLTQKSATWEGTVPCNASAQTISASVNNAAGTKAQCSAQVASIPIWVQTNGGNCAAVCSGVKRVSATSPRYGNRCVSGEVRGDASGIKYSRGIWGAGVEFYHSQSVGGNCYGSTNSKAQKQDNDRTDVTMGCYCQ